MSVCMSRRLQARVGTVSLQILVFLTVANNNYLTEQQIGFVSYSFVHACGINNKNRANKSQFSFMNNQ